MACTTDQRMSFFRDEWGLDDAQSNNIKPTLKRKYQWFFKIQGITGGNNLALPCIKAARPKIQFREMQAEHLNEVIFYPSKPEWQPIQISLYDRCLGIGDSGYHNPIFTWLQMQYNPSNLENNNGCSNWYPTIQPLSFKPCALLSLYDGCGTVIEEWQFEHCYPQNIDWGDLDMSDSAVITVDFSLRYDRAWQISPSLNHPIYDETSTNCTQCPDSICTPFSGTQNENPTPPSPGEQTSPGHQTNGPTFQPSTNTYTFGMAAGQEPEPDFIML